MQQTSSKRSILSIVCISVLCLASCIATTIAKPAIPENDNCSKRSTSLCETRPVRNCSTHKSHIHQCNTNQRTNITLNVVSSYPTRDESWMSIRRVVGRGMGDSVNTSGVRCTQRPGNGPTKTLCQWNYVCNFNSSRIPNYLYRAELKPGSVDEYNLKSGPYCQCEPIIHPVNVLKLECNPNSDVEEWKLEEEYITVAYTCVKKPQ